MATILIMVLLVILTTARKTESSYLIRKPRSPKNRGVQYEFMDSHTDKVIVDDIAVRLLIPRRTTFDWIFTLSHIVALLRCISTIGAPLAEAISDLSLEQSVFSTNILPCQSLPAIRALLQVSLSLCCHYGYTTLLSRRPWIRKLIYYYETEILSSASAAYVAEGDISGRGIRMTSEMIVPLDISSITSVSQCLELLKVFPDSSKRRKKVGITASARKISNTIARQFQCNDIKYFLFQNEQESFVTTSRDRDRQEVKSKMVKNSEPKRRLSKLLIIPADSHFYVNLEAVERAYIDALHLDRGDTGSDSGTSSDIKPREVSRIGLTSAAAESRLEIFGENSFLVPLPTLREKILSHFFSPINMLQMLFQFLSVLEEPLQAPLCRIFLTIFTNSCAIIRESESAKMLNKEASPNYKKDSLSKSASSLTDSSTINSTIGTTQNFLRCCQVVRDGVLKEVLIANIVPGDILYLVGGSIPADCLLLEGACLVDEAIQTGEAVPQSKVPITSLSDNEISLSFMKHQSYILFSGTDIVQITDNEDLSKSKSKVDQNVDKVDRKIYVKCLVLRTGFASSQGKLLRKMKSLGNGIRGRGKGSGIGGGLLSNEQRDDLFALLAILGGSSIFTSFYLFRHCIANPSFEKYRLLVQIARIIVSMASPDIVKDLTYTITAGIRRLTREEQVYCLDPSKLTRAGLVTACLFDKTGTISTDIVVADRATTLTNIDKMKNIEKNRDDDRIGFSQIEISPIGMNAVRDIDSGGHNWFAEEWNLSSSPIGLQRTAACCHSLMELLRSKDDCIDAVADSKRYGKFVGDPLESALLHSLIGPFGNRTKQRSEKGREKVEEKESERERSSVRVKSKAESKDILGNWEFDVNTKTAAWSPLVGVTNGGRCSGETEKENSLKSLVKSGGFQMWSKVSYPFNAELQRMTVIAKVSSLLSIDSSTIKSNHFCAEESDKEAGNCMRKNANQDRREKNEKFYNDEGENKIIEDYLIACKGSPESVFSCLCDSQRLDPSFRSRYHEEYERLAGQGKRVIAFASRDLKYNHGNLSLPKGNTDHSSGDKNSISFYGDNDHDNDSNNDNYKDNNSNNDNYSSDDNIDRIQLKNSGDVALGLDRKVMRDTVLEEIEAGRENRDNNESGVEYVNITKHQKSKLKKPEKKLKKGKGSEKKEIEGKNSREGEVWATHLLSSSREDIEKDLQFQGFVSFLCPLRCDSKAAILTLRNADMKVAMVTGDSLLTALHTARSCALIGCKNNEKLTSDEEVGCEDLGHRFDRNRLRSIGIDSRKGEDNNAFFESSTDDITLILTLQHNSNDESDAQILNRVRADTTITAANSMVDKTSNKRNGKGPSLVWCNMEGRALYQYESEKTSFFIKQRNINRRKSRHLSMIKNKSKNDNIEKGIDKDKNDHNVGDIEVSYNRHDEKDDILISMSAKELSLLGGFNLATTGDVIIYLSNKRRFRSYENSNKKMKNDRKGSGLKKARRNKKWKNRKSFSSDGLCALKYFKVFARVDPETKSTVVRSFQMAGEVVLMCGDGSNDVAALGSADVGVALLTGFKLTNSDINGNENENRNNNNKTMDVNNENVKPILRKKEIPPTKERQSRYDSLSPSELLTEIESTSLCYEREGKWFPWLRAAVQVITLERKKITTFAAVTAAKKREIQINSIKEKIEGKNENNSIEKIIADRQAGIRSDTEGKGDEEGDVPKIGDASIAAHFTARKPSILSVVNIIRHGRAAHALVLQSFMVATIESLLRGHALSVLYLHGVKYSSGQMVAFEILSTCINVGMLQVPPNSNLSPQRLSASIFSSQIQNKLIVQIIIQFGSIHLGLMIGRNHDKEKSKIPTFPLNKKSLSTILSSSPAVQTYNPYPVLLSPMGSMEMGCVSDNDLFAKEYSRSAVNTVMFLVPLMQLASIPLSTYIGEPFLPAISRVPSLHRGIATAIIFAISVTAQIVPGLSETLKLIVFPNFIVRVGIVLIVVGNLMLSLCYGRT